MKQNRAFKIGGCGECPDCQWSRNLGPGYRCLKYNIKSDSREELFRSCHLPEIKEIKVWFEKRPPEAQPFDLCVYQNEERAENEFPWEIELKIKASGIWIDIVSCTRKAQAEEFLECKIPDEVKNG